MDEFDLLLQEAEELSPPGYNANRDSDLSSKPEPKRKSRKTTNTFSNKLPSVEKNKPRPQTTKDSRKSTDKSFAGSDFSGLLDFEVHDIEESIDKTEEDFTLTIEARIKKFRETTKRELEDEKNQLLQEFQEKLAERKKYHQESLEIKKQIYEQELKELEHIRISYEKMETLTDNLGFNTNLLNNISLKINENKEEESREKFSKLLQVEKNLEERETRILAQEYQLEKEKMQVQENFEYLSKIESERRSRFEQEEKQIKAEKDKLYNIFQLVTQQTQEKKQEIIRETQKIKVLQESLEKRKAEVRNGVNSTLQQLDEYEELLIQKHEETLKLINQERRQISDKRAKIEDARYDTRGFEEKINQQTSIIEKKEQELNNQVEELIKNKNILESQRSVLEGEMQSLHQLSLKLHTQSEEISKSKEQLEYEINYLNKLEEDTENLKVSSRNDLVTAKEYCRQLELQMKTYEKMSVNLIQDLHNSIITPANLY